MIRGSGDRWHTDGGREAGIERREGGRTAGAGRQGEGGKTGKEEERNRGMRRARRAVHGTVI